MLCIVWWLAAIVIALGALVAGYSANFFAPVIEVAVAVDIVLVHLFGWDPGKLVSGLRVVDDAGAPPSWGQSFLRAAVFAGPLIVTNNFAVYTDLGASWGAYALAAAALVWLGVLAVSVVSDVDSRGLHDRIARTRVVDIRSTTMSDRVRSTRRSPLRPPF